MITIKNQESQKPYHSNRSSRKKKPWSIYGVSVPGAYHLQNDIPCQDSHSFGVLNKFWKYAIVCDGAGSLENSDLGSEFLTSIASKVIKKTLSKETWYHSAKIPDETSWSVAANKIIKELFRSLWQYAQKIEINYKSMGATVNLMVFNDNGYLSVHVGDGRATVLTSDNEWIAAIKPFKGENAGETVFITSEYTWLYPEECIETNAKSIKIKAIALLSDGLESYSFICNVPDTNAPSIFLDPNQPYDKFFNTNIDAVRNMRKNNISDEEITDKLHHYLLNGHPIISVEPDDKTIIVGFLNEDL